MILVADMVQSLCPNVVADSGFVVVYNRLDIPHADDPSTTNAIHGKA